MEIALHDTNGTFRSTGCVSQNAPLPGTWSLIPPDPLFILGAPRSYTSVVCAMVGQHPQMYGVPETHLFGYETMAERQQACIQATYPQAHGLLRLIAQLYFGAQTDQTITLAAGRLRRRLHFTTGMMLEELAARIHPRILVDKSPSIVYRLESMQRALAMFPGARFLHLVRHPRAHGESVMKYIDERRKRGPIPRKHWLYYIATYQSSNADDQANSPRTRHLDPQHGWHALNNNIREFLDSVVPGHKKTIRGEDLITDPNCLLKEIAEWMGLRTDAQAIEEMKHPERSPYACFGPPTARYGNDMFFLSDPVLRSSQAKTQSLDGPLSWRSDGSEFSPAVKDLARQFGYS